MKSSLLSLLLLASFSVAHAQLTSTQMGSAGNVYSVLQGNVNSLAADEATNSIVFVHRNNPGVNGGSTAELRYDISSNGGSTFTIDQGVLNPNADVVLNATRYPNAVVYNPAGNTNTSNAYLGYYGSTVDINTNNWNGHISGVAQLNNNAATFTETINTFNSGNTLIGKSLVRGAPGVFWAADHGYDSGTTLFTGEIVISKGIWNNNTNDIDWSVDTIIDPTNYDTFLNGNPQVAALSLNIAFDPTGTTGWLAFNTDMDNDNDAIFNPTFYYTDDAGATWQGPIVTKLHTYQDLENFTGANGTTEKVTAAFDADLAVDVNGVPHMLVVIGPAPTTAYSVFNPSATFKLGVYDLTVDTSATGKCQVQPHFLRELNTFRGTFGAAVQDNRPQISRTADGEKLFFGWLDSPATALNNSTPNLFGVGMDVVNNTKTAVTNFTGSDANWDQLAFFALFAEEAFDSQNNFTIPTMFTEMTGTDLDPVNFHYIENIEFSANDFTIPTPNFTASIYTATDPFCNGTNTGKIAVLAYESTEGSPLNTGASSGQISSANATEGLTFTPPTNMVITGLQVPTSVGTAPQNLQVIQYLGPNAASGSLFTTLYYDTAITSTGVIPVYIPLEANKAVGIFAGRGDATNLDMATGGNSGLNANIGGTVGQVERLEFSNNIAAGPADPTNVSTGNGPINDIYVEFVVSPGITYSWNDANTQTTPEAIDLSSGTYTVTVSNALNCEIVLTDSIGDPPAIIVSSSSNDVNCFGESDGAIDISPSGGLGNFTYQWNNNSTSEDRSNLSAGTYTVSVTDDVGCTVVETYTISEPDTLIIGFPTIDELECNGDNSGAIDIDVFGGTSPFGYAWFPGGITDEDPSGLASGTYDVEVTDANGCTAIGQYFVPEPEPIVVLTNSTADYNGNSGSVSVATSGDFPPFSYQWSTTPPSSTGTVFNLAAGTYTITVTDNNGCSTTSTVTVDNVTSAGPTLTSGESLSIYPNPTGGELHVNFELVRESHVVLRLTDLSGRNVARLDVGQSTGQEVILDLSETPPGIYFLHTDLDERSVINRIVITR